MIRKFFTLACTLRSAGTNGLGRLCRLVRPGWSPGSGGLPERTSFDSGSLGAGHGVRELPGYGWEAGELQNDSMPVFCNQPEMKARFEEQKTSNWEGSQVYEIKDATVYPSEGMVADRDGILLGDLCRRMRGRPSPERPFDHPIYLRIRPWSQESREGTSLLLNGPSPDVYFHWLFDVLGRAGMLQPTGGFETADRILVAGRRLPFKVAGLKRCGIDLDRVEFLGETAVQFRCERLLVTSQIGAANAFPHPLVDYLRALSPPAGTGGTGGRRLFLGRKDTKRRRLLCPGYEEILAKLGFEWINPGDFEFEAQAELMGQAEVIAGIHGSGFANLCFASPGTRVVEILPGAYRNIMYWRLCCRLGLDYACILGEGRQGRRGSMMADITIAPGDFQEALERSLENLDPRIEQDSSP